MNEKADTDKIKSIEEQVLLQIHLIINISRLAMSR